MKPSPLSANNKINHNSKQDKQTYILLLIVLYLRVICPDLIYSADDGFVQLISLNIYTVTELDPAPLSLKDKETTYFLTS